MKVLLAMADRYLARDAFSAVKAQGHEPIWAPSIDERKLVLSDIGLMIIGDTHSISSPSYLARAKKIPYVAVHQSNPTREFEIQFGTIVELPPHLLAPALTADALNIEQAVTWTPGKAAEAAMAEIQRTCVPDADGWRNRETQEWQRPKISYATYIAELRKSMRFKGYVADDIPEPYFSRLARIVIQDGLGNRTRVERVGWVEGTGLVAHYVGEEPEFSVNYRTRSVRFERA